MPNRPKRGQTTGRTGAKIDLGFLYGGPELDPNAIEANASNPEFSGYGDTELASEGTGESVDTIREPRVKIPSAPQAPQYKKPSIWQNLITEGRAGQQYGQLQGQSSLAQFQADSSLRNSQIMAEQTNNYNNALQKTMHDFGVDADRAKQILADKLAKEQVILKQNAETFAGYGIPYDPKTAQPFIDQANTPEFRNSQLGARQSKGFREMSENQLAEDKARLDQEELRTNRPSLLSLSQEKLKGALNEQQFNNRPEVQSTMFSANAMKQPLANRLSEAQAQAYGNLNVGGNLVDRANGQVIFKAPNQRLETLMGLDSKFGLGLGSSGNSNTNQPRINIPGLTPDNKPPLINTTPSNPGQQATEGFLKGPDGKWYKRKSQVVPTN